MRKALLVASAVLLLNTASAAFAGDVSPFADVPLGHWAYGSVAHLATSGFLRGYPDGTFKGDKPVTRYAMAVIVAQLVSNIERLGANAITKEDLKDVEKLTIEFADELEVLGVKVNALEDDLNAVKEDVAGLKNDVSSMKEFMDARAFETVKLSGDLLVRHYDYNWDKHTVNGHHTESRLRLQLDTKPSENISIRARWNMLGDSEGVYSPWRGSHWDGDDKGTGDVEVAYIKIDNVFGGTGSVKLGRDFYTHGHGLVVHNYMDAISYSQLAGDVNLAFNIFYNRDNNVDYHNIWNINVDGSFKNRNFYLGFYYNSYDDQFTPRLIDTPSDSMNNITDFSDNPVYVKDAKRTIIEMGSKGDIDKNGNFKYDVAGVYSKVEYTHENPNNTAVMKNYEQEGWLGHAAVTYDDHKSFTAKVAYTYADEDSAANISRSDDNRWCGNDETPFEDILWYQVEGHNTYMNMLRFYNLQDVKLQVTFRPHNNDKHQFRLAYDFVTEGKDHYSTYRDAKNTLGYAKVDFNMLTFEYSYQLAENTKLRVGYAKVFENSLITRGQRNPDGSLVSQPVKAKDQSIFFSEVYSKF